MAARKRLAKAAPVALAVLGGIPVAAVILYGLAYAVGLTLR